MRNLKRALSLALALVMVLSMMVVGAGAVSIDDFTDADEIVNTEAVTTMVSLGVIDGNDDGSYNPTGVVKRGEMAKLIAVMLNGGKEPTLGQMTATFSDTVGHWAQSYITYVANLGIIDGRGDGTFGPNDDVTGAEAAKMILTALGYRSEIEGFTGANWAINVQLKANDIDLFEGLTINPDEGLSRDNTAQMLYNAVQAQEVEYRNLEGNYDGVIYPTEKGTVLENRFNVRKVEGVVEATSLISLNGSTAVEGKTRLNNIEYNGEFYEDKNGDPIPVAYPIAIDSALLGQRVVIYVKGLNDLSPNASGMEVVGTAIVSDDNTVVDTAGRLKDTDAVKDALRGSGISVPTAGVNGISITSKTTAPLAGCTGVTGTDSYPGLNQRFIDNTGDGTVDLIIRTLDTLTKVNTYNATTEKMNLAGIGTIDFEDVLNPEDVAQGDYVLVYNYDDTYVLESVETVSGVVSAFVNNASTPSLSKITVEDTSYGWSQGKNLAPDVLDKANTPGGDLDDLVDGTYTLYLDTHGNMLGYVEDEGAIGNYAVITGVNSTGHADGFLAVEVKVIMADGSTGKYDVNLLASANKYGFEDLSTNAAKESAMYDLLTGDTAPRTGDVVDANSMLDTLVSYSISDGTITLIDPDVATDSYHGADYNNPTGSELVLKNSTAGYKFGADSLTADNRTVFFFKDANGSYSAVNGLSNVRASGLTAKTDSDSQAIYYKPESSASKAARAIFVTVTDIFTSNSNYAYVSGDYTRTTEGNDTVYSYPVVFENGETGTLKTKSTINGTAKEKVHEYQNDGDYVNFGTDDKMVNGKIVIGIGNGSITVADADNVNTGIASYPTNGAKVWNVEDVDTVFDAGDFQLNDKVALVLDEDYKVRTGFVYDRQDGEMVAEPTAFTIGGHSDGDTFAVVPEGTLVYAITTATGTTLEKVTASLDGGAAVTLFEKGKVAQIPYTVPAGLANGQYELVLKATVSDDEEIKNDLVKTITVTLVVSDADKTIVGDTTATNLAADLGVGKNILITGNLTVDSALNLPNGATVTVEGDVDMNAALSGTGKLVVKGTTTVANGLAIGADVDTGALVFEGTATVSVSRTVNVTDQDVTVTLAGTTTVDGNLNIPNGTLVLNGQTLNGTGGVVDVDKVHLGSKISGTVTVNANSAVLVDDFTIDGGTLNVATDVADETAGTATITVSGGAIDVKGDLAGDVTVSGAGNLTVTGTIDGDLSVESDANGDVTAGAVNGDVSNASDDAEVSVGGGTVDKSEPITNEVKVANLHDTRTEEEGGIADADLYTAGSYTVTGTKSVDGTTTTYDLTLSIQGLKEHQNAQDAMGYWVGITVNADSSSFYKLGWGSGTGLTAGDIDGSLSGDAEASTGKLSAYRNVNASDAQGMFFLAIKDGSNNVSIYNVTLDYTLAS